MTLNYARCWNNFYKKIKIYAVPNPMAFFLLSLVSEFMTANISTKWLTMLNKKTRVAPDIARLTCWMKWITKCCQEWTINWIMEQFFHTRNWSKMWWNWIEKASDISVETCETTNMLKSLSLSPIFFLYPSACAAVLSSDFPCGHDHITATFNAFKWAVVRAPH